MSDEQTIEQKKAAAFDLLRELLKTEAGRKEFSTVFTETISNAPVRPTNWSKLTVSPYFKEHFARELKIVLDDMLQDGKDKEFRYDDFTLSKKSLYNKIHQAWMFLAQFLDPDNTYKTLRQRTVVTTEKTGIRIQFIRDTDTLSKKAVSVEPIAKSFEWKNKLEDFIEKGKVDEKLIIEDISLTQEEIEDLEIQFANIQGILHKFTPTSIKVMKIDPEKLASKLIQE